MSMQKKANWSVRTLLEKCSKLGIPHFQRGLVWSDSNISSLLESLYFDTPCGSLVLWENPDKNSTFQYGIPLINLQNKQQEIDYFLVDGQQRTRSLYSVFFESQNGNSNTNEEDSTDNSLNDSHDNSSIPYVWAVNLAVLEKILSSDVESGETPISKKIINSDSKTAQTLFVKIRDPKSQKINYLKNLPEGTKRFPPEYQYQYNYIPLSYFFSESNIDLIDDNALENLKKVFFKDSIQYNKDNKCLEIGENHIPVSGNIIFLKLVPSEENNEDMYKKITNILTNFRHNLEEMIDREFAISILTTGDMSDVIHTYIRINGGGRPVQQEEKTLARLVELCPENIKGTSINTFLTENPFAFVRKSPNEIFQWYKLTL